jgi:glycyl-tRNA synthetase
LSPVSVEITYGLERILMLLQVSLESLFSYSIFFPFYTLKLLPTHWQGVDHFKKIQYADGITYGELFLENEYANLLKILITSFSTEYFNLEIQ